MFHQKLKWEDKMKLLSRILIVIAVVLMLYGIINFFFDFPGIPNSENFFHIANSFILLAICTRIFYKEDQKK